MAQKNKVLLCPCGLGVYRNCCQLFHENGQKPQTAEKLMRSRYSAYAMELSDYIQRTWHISRRPENMDLSEDSLHGKWIGLTVIAHSQEGDKAEVEFVARYKPHTGPATRLHERSRFVREEEQWFYVDGDLFQE